MLLKGNFVYLKSSQTYSRWLIFFADISSKKFSAISNSGQIEKAGNGTELTSFGLSDNLIAILRARNLSMDSFIKNTLPMTVKTMQIVQKILSHFVSDRRLMYCQKRKRNYLKIFIGIYFTEIPSKHQWWLYHNNYKLCGEQRNFSFRRFSGKIWIKLE